MILWLNPSALCRDLSNPLILLHQCLYCVNLWCLPRTKGNKMWVKTLCSRGYYMKLFCHSTFRNMLKFVSDKGCTSNIDCTLGHTLIPPPPKKKMFYWQMNGEINLIRYISFESPEWLIVYPLFFINKLLTYCFYLKRRCKGKYCEYVHVTVNRLPLQSSLICWYYYHRSSYISSLYYYTILPMYVSIWTIEAEK